MASLPLLLFFPFLSFLFFSLNATSPAQLFFPVTKDLPTLQYVARIYYGDPGVPIELVLDLGNPFVWIDCASVDAPLLRNVIPGCSMKCSKGEVHEIGKKQSTCSFSTSCNVFARNGATGVAAQGELAEGVVAVDSGNGLATVHHFLFSSAPAFLLQGLATGSRGMLGLGKSSVSLPSQFGDISAVAGQRRKFAVCLSPSEGVVLIGNGDSNFGAEITGSLLYTPLFIINQDYFIKVQSIKINGKRISIEKLRLVPDEQGRGGTKLSTTVPYTSMESSIYVAFTKAYAKAAALMNMTMAEPVAPFGLCFSSKGIGGSVPEIDLVLQSEMVKWRIDEGNSMVRVSEEVICLGFVDGGVEQESSIVIGGLQLEENFLEFDAGGSRLGFSSSLLMRGKSCSDFRRSYRGMESL
ncbi:hypothetical protein SLA2020_499710 [Shorea laevis]